MNFTLLIFLIALIVLIFLLKAMLNNGKNSNLYKSFAMLILMFIIHILGLTIQIIFEKSDIDPVYFEYIAYIRRYEFFNSNIYNGNYIFRWFKEYPFIKIVIYYTSCFTIYIMDKRLSSFVL